MTESNDAHAPCSLAPLQGEEVTQSVGYTLVSKVGEVGEAPVAHFPDFFPFFCSLPHSPTRIFFTSCLN